MLQGMTERLENQGYTFIPATKFCLNTSLKESFDRFRGEYATLPEDRHLNAGEGERFRRYARLSIDPVTFEVGVFPHSRFFQAKEFDELYGDIHRQFAPATQSILENRFLRHLIQADFRQFPLTSQEKTELWEVSVHIIKIAATPQSEIGRPAPEGIHQDGYHFGGVHLMDRENLTGAQSRVYDLEKNQIDSGYLLNPLDSMLMNDRRIFHGVQPFCAADPQQVAYRDILILLFQPVSVSPQPRATSTLL